MNKKKKSIKLSPDKDISSDVMIIDPDEITQALENIDSAGEDILFNDVYKLTDMSADNYNKFKKGLLPRYFADDDNEIDVFFDYKRRAYILNLITFLDLAMNKLVDPEKLQKASLRDLTTTLKTSLELVQHMAGKTADSGLDNEELSEKEVNLKLKRLQDRLQVAEDIEDDSIIL